MVIGKLLGVFLTMWFVGSLVFGTKDGFILATAISLISIILFVLYLYLDSWYFDKVGWKKVPNIMDVDIKNETKSI